MKFKKVIATAMAAIAALTMCAASLTACKDECDHKYTWKVTKPATCLEEGEEEGICGLCGYVDTRVVPVSDKHRYGEWDIKVPTATEEGKATKVCSLSASHKTEVTLPVISEDGTGYTSSKVTTPPSAITEGERTFVLAHDEGDISFTVAVAPTGIESVSDAIEVAATKAYLIRSVSGTVHVPSGAAAEVHSPYFYEFGDNYTHIYFKGDNLEYWCSLDENEKIFAVLKDEGGNIAQQTTADAGLMAGYGFHVAYAGFGPLYGVESFLSYLYEKALGASSQDFEESYERVNGEFVYNFSFGYVNGRFYNVLSTTFTLTPFGAVKTVDFTSDVYGSDSWDYDEATGKAHILEGVTAPNGTEKITAVTVLCDSEEGAEVPVNPYQRDWLKVKSFDVTFNGRVLTEEDVVTTTATVTSATSESVGTVLTLTNVKNNGEGVSDINYDPVSVYRRIGNVDTLLTFGLSDNNISVIVTGTRITIRSHVVGSITLAIKTQSGSVTKIVKLQVNPATPSKLYPSVYEYGDEGYVWHDTLGSNDPDDANAIVTANATIYTGQELLVRAVAPANESAYVDSSVNAELYDWNLDILTGDFFSLDTEGIAYKFKCSQTGTYYIRLYSTRNSKIQTRIAVTVENPPAVASVLAGTYTCRIEYPEYANVTVTFMTGNLVTVNDVVQGTETLKWEWNETTKTLTTTHIDGAQLGYSITLNEVYRPVLSHKTGFTGVNETESVVLQRNS